MVMIMIIVVSFIAFVETSAAWAQGFCCRVGMCSRGLRNLNSILRYYTVVILRSPKK